MEVNERPTLGPMVAAFCLQQLRLYTEDLAGRGPILGAGRLRGEALIRDRGLAGSNLETDKMHQLFLEVFGIEGTRLCTVTEVAAGADGGFEIKLVEGACTYMAQADEPMCVYTLGVFVGAVQTFVGRPMEGVEIACQAIGDPACHYEIRPHAALL
jgi:predicted hydrocarbon binding protein